MGRAGGGGGGVHHSSGGHSVSHHSSGHYSSSSSSSHRAGSSSSHSYSSPSHSSYHRSTPPPPPRHHYGSYGSYGSRGYNRGYNDGYERGRRASRSSGGCGNSLVITLLVVFFILALFTLIAGMSDNFGNGYYEDQGTTIVREKLDSGNAYMNDCIEDELGWFDNEAKTETELRDFWEETGVQPYVILKDYDSTLMTEEQKEQWAVDYYESNFSSKGREDVCLFVYYAEEDVEGDVGYMTLTEGYESGSVMDSEAEEIFWKYIDRYWYSDSSTDDVFINAYDKTGNAIMHVSKTEAESKADVTKALAAMVAAGAAIIVVSIAAKNAKEKRQREKEKEEATERILNTPLDTFESDAASNLASKYEDTDKSQETTGV